MDLASRLDAAEQLGRGMNDLIGEFEITSDDRTSAAATSFGIARDHHAALVLLLRNGLHSSAMALLRCLLEAYLRGLWLRHCATDSEVAAHMEGANPPATMIQRIEHMPGFTEGRLSRAKKDNWDALCQYTHTGGLHLRQWRADSAIEPNFPEEELLTAIDFADRYMALACLELAQMKIDGDHGRAVLTEIEKRFLTGDRPP